MHNRQTRGGRFLRLCDRTRVDGSGKAVSRPFGTWSFPVTNPTLKRWAILGMSLRDRSLVDFPLTLAQSEGLFDFRCCP
jgi:hypothetical protein